MLKIMPSVDQVTKCDQKNVKETSKIGEKSSHQAGLRNNNNIMNNKHTQQNGGEL